MCPWLTKQVQLNVFASIAILRETGLNSPPGNHDRWTSTGSTLLSPQQQCEAADPVERKHVAAPASSGVGQGGVVGSAVQRLPSDKGPGGWAERAGQTQSRALAHSPCWEPGVQAEMCP